MASRSPMSVSLARNNCPVAGTAAFNHFNGMAWRGVNCGGSTLEDAFLWPEKKLREDRAPSFFSFLMEIRDVDFLDSIQIEGCCAGVIFTSTNIQAQQCEGNGGHNPMHDLLSQRHLPTTQKPFWLGATEHPTATFSIGGSSLRIATQNNNLLALCRIATKACVVKSLYVRCVGMDLYVSTERFIRVQFLVQGIGRLTQVLD